MTGSHLLDRNNLGFSQSAVRTERLLIEQMDSMRRVLRIGHA